MVNSVPTPGVLASRIRPPCAWTTARTRLSPSPSPGARLSVHDARGAQVDLRDATVPGDQPRVVRVSLPALGPGTYTVRYRVLSVDDHVVGAAFTFMVRGAGR
jgi:methionine-rich copper-binding protein CopC